VSVCQFFRVREYAALPPEEQPAGKMSKASASYADNPDETIPAGWPNTGSVEFRNSTIRYDLDGPDILKGINLKFDAGERVAIIGRTGSGKTTVSRRFTVLQADMRFANVMQLVLSLLRLTHVTEGQILFDGVDINLVPRPRLRQSLTIIPQDAVLFNGTIATNLDPTGQVEEAELERTLASCSSIASFQAHADSTEDSGAQAHADVTNESPATEGADGHASEEATTQGISLSTPVKARGANFSHGQRQVLSLCRALVRKSKLMLLDEATASMDYNTDQAIQTVLRQEVVVQGPEMNADTADSARRTLVTVAHRLRTIADYDKLVVMASGEVVEFGSPSDLLEARGTFYDMVCHSGERDELERLVKGQHEHDTDLLSG
jgi:ABC-type multidrug transport system fused ATPase/permease subunit